MTEPRGRPVLPDFVRAPNQADDPALYETENAAIDPEGVLAAALWWAAPWDNRDVLDLDCGSGYWLPAYTERARSVTGVEPDPALLPLAGARDPSARVLHGSAERIPLPDASVDVVHARFAYFFPPGCDAGLAEVLRVLRPGGALVVIDNDHRWGEFARLLESSPWASPQGQAETKDAWWTERGASRQEVHSSWGFPDRAALAAVLNLESHPIWRPPGSATTPTALNSLTATSSSPSRGTERAEAGSDTDRPGLHAGRELSSVDRCDRSLRAVRAADNWRTR